MQVLLSNPARPDTEGVTLPFPIPDAEYGKCLELLTSIGLGAVTEQDCRIDAVFHGPPALDCLIGMDANVDELDVLARILENIEIDGDLEKFEAMAEIKGYRRIEDLINLSLCCQNIGIITDFRKLKEAGQDYVATNVGPIPPETVKGEDGEAILKSLIAEGKGRITQYGVVFDGGLRVERIYQGGNLPAVANQVIIAEAVLTPTTAPQDRDELLLLLPMPEKRLERMLERAGFETNDDFNAELRYMELPPEVNEIIERQPKALYDMDRLCQAAQPMNGKQKETLAAAVLMAKPECAAEIRELALNLEQFELVTGIGSAEEYGEYLIKESGFYTFDENLARYYDYDKCGREQMASEQGAFTELGYTEGGVTQTATTPIMVTSAVLELAYAILYSNGELVFQRGSTPESGRTVTKTYSGVEDTDDSEAPWYAKRRSIKTVTFADAIRPYTTACWFEECENLTAINGIEKLDTSLVTNMEYMFDTCESLEEVDVSGFDVSHVTNMRYMFGDCSELTTLDVADWDVSSVKNMTGLFSGCNSLDDCNVSAWDTSSATTMAMMFVACRSLKTLDLSRWNTASVQDMRKMFRVCTGLTSCGVEMWDTSKVKSFEEMFYGCSNLGTLDLSTWDTAAATNMTAFFSGCSTLTTVWASDSFVVPSAAIATDMFLNTYALVGGNGTRCTSANQSYTYARIDRPGSPGFFTER